MHLCNIFSFAPVEIICQNNVFSVKYFAYYTDVFYTLMRSKGVKMKYIFALMLSLTLSGCTASDWVDAAGGIMQATDKSEKDSRNKRIKAANKAAGY